MSSTVVVHSYIPESSTDTAWSPLWPFLLKLPTYVPKYSWLHKNSMPLQMPPTWVWVNSRRQWRTRKEAWLTAVHRVTNTGHDLATDQQQPVIWVLLSIYLPKPSSEIFSRKPSLAPYPPKGNNAFLCAVSVPCTALSSCPSHITIVSNSVFLLAFDFL